MKQSLKVSLWLIVAGMMTVLLTTGCTSYQKANNGSCFAFNKADNTLYVLKVKVMAKNGGKEMVPYYDRYYVYQFDGEHFIGKGEEGGFWLHPSIRQFKALVYYGKTEDYQVRVDSLAAGTYRLTAWKNKDDMNDAPDILVEGGVLLKSNYVFKNGDYTYTVIDQEFGQDEFRNYDKNGKLFISKKLNKVYN